MIVQICPHFPIPYSCFSLRFVILFVGIEKILLVDSLLVVSRVDFYFFPSIIKKDADARKGCPWQPFVHATICKNRSHGMTTIPLDTTPQLEPV